MWLRTKKNPSFRPLSDSLCFRRVLGPGDSKHSLISRKTGKKRFEPLTGRFMTGIPTGVAASQCLRQLDLNAAVVALAPVLGIIERTDL